MAADTSEIFPWQGFSRPSWRESLIWGWSFELFNMVSSLACMAAIVAILVTTKDRPADEWNFYFSISATLALLGMIAKSTAAIGVGACISQYKWLYFKRAPRKLTDLDLLEEASRGPLGSLILLAKRPMGLASIGAIVTLLALAVEVFVQQMVQLKPRDVAFDDGKAVLGLAHTYNGGAVPQSQETYIYSAAGEYLVTHIRYQLRHCHF
jgi:hypothetical protein